jgi:hypothetical protein
MTDEVIAEARSRIPDYLEISGCRVALDDIMSDDNLRLEAIAMLDAKLPCVDKDFTPEITVVWITLLYLRNDRRALEMALKKTKNPRVFKVVH